MNLTCYHKLQLVKGLCQDYKYLSFPYDEKRLNHSDVENGYFSTSPVIYPSSEQIRKGCHKSKSFR